MNVRCAIPKVLRLIVCHIRKVSVDRQRKFIKDLRRRNDLPPFDALRYLEGIEFVLKKALGWVAL